MSSVFKVLRFMSVIGLSELTSNSYLSESSLGYSDLMAGIVIVFLLKVGVLLCYVGVEARLDFGVEVLKVRVES